MEGEFSASRSQQGTRRIASLCIQTYLQFVECAARRTRKNEERAYRNRRKGKTDWARVDALTDEDIAKAVANDPDAVPIDIDWSDAVLVIPPKKTAISIRLDEDVLNYFKRQGEGYQRRINAVLRSYMQQKVKAKKRA